MSVIYAVGVGPGDPELLTRKAERILRSVDVIMAPVATPGDAGVAMSIVNGLVDEQRQQIILHQFPMTSDRDRLLPAWQEAATLLAEHAAAGRSVAFITIGDSLFYSTFIYLLRILRQHWPQIPVEIIPGISSIFASSALAALPLVEGEEKMLVVPATAGIDQIRAALACCETVVLLKVKPLFADIVALLRECGEKVQVLFVERVGSERQKILTELDEIASHSPDYLSLMIIKQQALPE